VGGKGPDQGLLVLVLCLIQMQGGRLKEGEGGVGCRRLLFSGCFMSAAHADERMCALGAADVQMRVCLGWCCTVVHAGLLGAHVIPVSTMK